MTVEEILAAYDQTGLRPCQDKFYVANMDGDLCCPLTVLAIAAGIVSPSNPRYGEGCSHRFGLDVYAWSVNRYGKNKVVGFLDGWDWRWPGPTAPVTDQGYQDGFDLGKSAVKSLLLA